MRCEGDAVRCETDAVRCGTEAVRCGTDVVRCEGDARSDLQGHRKGHVNYASRHKAGIIGSNLVKADSVSMIKVDPLEWWKSSVVCSNEESTVNVAIFSSC